MKDLTFRFKFEKKWQDRGGDIKSRAFYTALKEELEKTKQNNLVIMTRIQTTNHALIYRVAFADPIRFIVPFLP